VKATRTLSIIAMTALKSPSWAETSMEVLRLREVMLALTTLGFRKIG